MYRQFVREMPENVEDNNSVDIFHIARLLKRRLRDMHSKGEGKGEFWRAKTKHEGDMRELDRKGNSFLFPPLCASHLFQNACIPPKS